MNAATTPHAKPASKEVLDLKALRQFVSGLLAEGQTDRAVELLFQLLVKLVDTNNLQAIRIAQLLKEQFGRRSEKLDPHQLELFLQSVDDQAKETAEETPEDKALEADVEKLKKLAKEKRGKAKRPGRNPLPDHLPREIIRLLPQAHERVCAECGEQKREIGVERSQVLELVPAHFIVQVFERVKMACKACEGEVVIARPADKPVDGGLPGCGLLAHLVVSKYKDHTPVNLLSDIYARLGVRINPSTLGSWVEVVTDWFQPLYKRLCQLTLSAYVLGVDDTGLKVLDQSHAHHIKRGHLWAYVGYEEGIPRRVAFDYTPNWEGEHPRAFMKSRRGYVQGDGYAGIEPFFAGPEPACVKVGCMMHARRYFHEALEASDLRAAAALKLFGRLYKVEELASLMNATTSERRELRQKHSKKLMERLYRFVNQHRGQAEPKTPMGKAITYATNQWVSLLRYLEDGAIPIDNGEVERQLRPIARGRKAYLFAGSDEGGRRAAVMYTLMGCCQLAGVEPLAYLTDVLKHLVAGWPMKRIDELLPENWKPASPEPSEAIPRSTSLSMPVSSPEVAAQAR